MQAGVTYRLAHFYWYLASYRIAPLGEAPAADKCSGHSQRCTGRIDKKDNGSKENHGNEQPQVDAENERAEGGLATYT